MQLKGHNLTAAHLQVAKNGDVYVHPDVTGGNPGMLLIFAKWCSHCHRFIPTFNDICDRLGSAFPCASIEDAQLKNQDQLVSALSFRGYPTIKFFDQTGKILGDYNGERSTDAILQNVCEVYHHCIKHH